MRAALLALALALAACDSTAPDVLAVDVSTLSHEPAALVGTWVIESVSVYGQCPEPCLRTFTPEEADFVQTLAFRADGTATVRTNDEPAREVAYAVQFRQYHTGGQAEVPELVLDGMWRAFGIDGDRLYIDDRPLDGALLAYRRR